MIRANKAWDGLPTQYLVGARSNADWIRLRGALAHERLADREGYAGPPVAQANQTFLSEMNGAPAVGDAAAALEANLELINATWRVRLAREPE